MGTAQKSLRIPQEVVKAIEELAEISGQDFTAVAVELLTEATKMRRCPGIVFVDGASGRRACIAGTGLDVWEVVATYKGLNRDLTRLHQAYHWLSEAQLRAALGYYAVYPDEIDRRISLNERWTGEQLRAQHPSLTVDKR
jgi:uncharacterized protein (DUF433 family)